MEMHGREEFTEERVGELTASGYKVLINWMRYVGGAQYEADGRSAYSVDDGK